MLHGMDIADVLPLTHLANGIRGTKILDVDAGPAFVGNAGHRPFAEVAEIRGVVVFSHRRKRGVQRASMASSDSSRSSSSR